MSKPDIEEGAGFYRFHWPDQQIYILLKRVREHRDGRTTGEVTISTDAEGYSPLLHRALFNLSSTETRVRLGKLLDQRFPEAHWEVLLETFCYLALERIRQGEPAIELWTTQESIEAPQYLLGPVMPIDKPTIIFGEGGVGKSLLALVFAMCITLPWQNNPLGLAVSEGSRAGLYLDYETDNKEIGWRMKCLRVGLGLPDFYINYRRCTLPLPDELEDIQGIIAETKSKWVIVDSLGAASGGNLNEAETAIRFFAALRSLKTTSLLIAHTAKESLGRGRGVFGSVFYFNSARSVWELKQVQEVGEDEISLGLYHRKSNVSRLHSPLGFKIVFNEDSYVVGQQDLSEVPALQRGQSTQVQILGLLRHGSMKVVALKEELDISDNAVRQALAKLKRAEKVIKVGDEWGLREGTYL